MTSARHDPLQRNLGLISMGLACGIWGLGPLWIRTLLHYLPATDVCLLRMTIGLLPLLPAFVVVDRHALVGMLRQPSTWYGGLAVALNTLSYAAALAYIRPAEVNLVFQLNVLTSALCGWWIFHERVPSRRWAAIAVALVGVTMVILARDAGPVVQRGLTVRLVGLGLGLLAGVGASLVQVSVRGSAEAGHSIAALVPMYLVADLCFATATGFHFEWRQPPDHNFWTIVLILSLVGTGLASIFSNFGIRRISLAQAGVTGSMQPVVTILVTAFAGELLPPVGLVGAVLVIGGVIASALLEQQVRSPARPQADDAWVAAAD